MKLFPAKCRERGNIAKTMTSNGKQFAVTREMLTGVVGHSRETKITEHFPLDQSLIDNCVSFLSGDKGALKLEVKT